MGLLRLFLALVVVMGHADAHVPAFQFINAFQAVNAFFVISGFYMALILNERYATPAENSKFYLNRAIRIYPVYLVGLLVCILIYSYLGWPTPFANFTALPTFTQVYLGISNILAVGLDAPYTLCLTSGGGTCIPGASAALIPPAWSISTELVFYAFAPFIVRSIYRCALLTISGAVYLWALPFIPMVFSPNGLIVPTLGQIYASYFALPASFLFFGVGSLSYHLLKSSPSESHIRYLFGAIAAIAILFSTPIVPAWVVILLAAAIPAVFSHTKYIKLDRLIGDLSYPVYILHWPILVAMNTTGMTLWPRAITTVFATIFLAIVVRVLIERPLERLRSSIRKSVQNKEPTLAPSRHGALAMVTYLSAVPFFIIVMLASQSVDGR